MNYRHAFHAGNFADLLKHALLLALLEALTAERDPLSVFDTHAGAGAYDLSGEMSRRTGEAQVGVFRLMAAKAAPSVFSPLIDAVRRLNGGADGALYPGSPLLTVKTLRPGDTYIGCELRADDHARLGALLRRDTPRGVKAQALLTDGYAQAATPLKGRRLTVIDPPFEQGDDYVRIVQTLARRGGGPAFVWLPLKDLDTFDRFLTDLERSGASDVQVAEVRLRPLYQPLKMNGCAVVLVDAPNLASPAQAAAEWIISTLGDAGGKARVWRL